MEPKEYITLLTAVVALILSVLNYYQNYKNTAKANALFYNDKLSESQKLLHDAQMLALNNKNLCEHIQIKAKRKSPSNRSDIQIKEDIIIDFKRAVDICEKSEQKVSELIKSLSDASIREKVSNRSLIEINNVHNKAKELFNGERNFESAVKLKISIAEDRLAHIQ